MVRKPEQRILGRLPHVGQPLGRYTVTEETVVADTAEQQGLCLGECRLVDLYIPGNGDLLHRLPYLDELRGACLRMRLDPPPLGPSIGLVVMVDVAEQQARARAMDDDADVLAHPDRGEVRVLRALELVELQAWMCRIHLQVERRCLHRLLLVDGQPGKTARESVGDAELHRRQSNSLLVTGLPSMKLDFEARQQLLVDLAGSRRSLSRYPPQFLGDLTSEVSNGSPADLEIVEVCLRFFERRAESAKLTNQFWSFVFPCGVLQAGHIVIGLTFPKVRKAFIRCQEYELSDRRGPRPQRSQGSVF